MQADTTVGFRVDPAMRQLLDRLRDEKDVNVSAWLRAAFEREFLGAETTEPLDSETTPGTDVPQPETTPIGPAARPGSRRWWFTLALFGEVRWSTDYQRHAENFVCWLEGTWKPGHKAE